VIDVMFSFKFVARQIMDQSRTFYKEGDISVSMQTITLHEEGACIGQNMSGSSRFRLSHYKLEIHRVAFVCCSGVGLLRCDGCASMLLIAFAARSANADCHGFSTELTHYLHSILAYIGRASAFR